VGAPEKQRFLNAGVTMATFPQLQQQLPEASFVPFECHRLATAELAFQNPRFEPDADLLERCAFAIRTEESEGAFTPASQQSFGERYGGEGLMHNGGGVRCGLFGPYQVKGIGRNPLAGEGSGFWYTHGGSSFEEGFAEMVWGEVLERVLPHGAVPVLALIGTGLQCWVKAPDGMGRICVPRALIVRPGVLRPAHFERAYHYRPSAEMRRALPHDTERTRHAIGALPDSLPRERGSDEASWQSLKPAQKLERGLHEFALRLAEQHATARARRFMHGALTSGNVALDGRWLDYSTTSALSCYANTVLGTNEPFWHDHTHLLQVLNNLCFYAGKYLPRAEGEALPRAKALTTFFSQHFALQMVAQFTKLTGYPESAIAPHAHAPAVLALATHLMKLARAGNERPFDGIPDAGAKRGYDLGQILCTLAVHPQSSELDARLEPLIACAATRRETTRLYGEFAALVSSAAVTPEERLALRRRVILQSAKAGRDVHFLYRNQLYGQLQRLAMRYPDRRELCTMFGRLLENVVNEIEVLHQRDTGGPLLAYRDRQHSVELDVREGNWRVRRQGRVIETHPIASGTTEKTLPVALYPAREWLGKSTWEALL